MENEVGLMKKYREFWIRPERDGIKDIIRDDPPPKDASIFGTGYFHVIEKRAADDLVDVIKSCIIELEGYLVDSIEGKRTKRKISWAKEALSRYRSGE